MIKENVDTNLFLCREGKPPWPLSKKPAISLKPGCFSPKMGRKRKKMSKSVSGYYKTKKNKERKKVA